MLLTALINGLLMGGIYALGAVGLSLIYGVMHIVNFAHGALLMTAMYISFWLVHLLGIDPYVTLLASVPLLFGLGFIIQKYVINRVLNAPRHDQLLITLGIALLIQNLALFLFSPDFRTIKVSYASITVLIGSVSVGLVKVIAFLCAILMTALLFLFLKYTVFGKSIKAAAEEPEGAQFVGIDLKRVYALTFGIGAACVGAAGSLVTPFFYISPDVGYVFLDSAFITVVIGGMGNPAGALLGGLIIGVAEALGATYLPGSMKHLAIWLVFVLVLLFRPSGLLGKRTHE